jgi:pre-rRNA-processing protein TSR3
MNDQSKSTQTRISVLMHRQDDPSKCTAAKLIKFKMATEVRKIPYNSIVLDPYSGVALTQEDKQNMTGICAIDCSWKLAADTIKIPKKLNIKNRMLPALLAGNPTNYAKLGMLSTSEAISGALYILGHKAHALEIMNKFKWGHTFIDLNHDVLEDYSNATEQNQIKRIEKEYFPKMFADTE